MKEKVRTNIVISWMAVGNDFNDELINKSGPSYSLHRFFYTKHNFHVLLYADNGTSQPRKKAEKLYSALQKDFKDHTIQLIPLKIYDVVSFHEIKPKIDQLISEYIKYEIDLFISPGTPMMQVCWVLAHIGGLGKTRLIQSRRPEHSKNKMAEFFETKISPSMIPYCLLIEKQEGLKSSESNYLEDGIEEAVKRARQIACVDKINTLITGETGTGKEGLAALIHQHSSRFNHPFITINCSAFSDDLLSAELFGSVKGAFTGAIDRKGLFETANGGTVFLDEIGDISPKMQQSLLRVLQDNTFMRLGHTKELKTDIRIIAATNKPLETMIHDGTFRADLYYRLSQTKLHLKPLRMRGYDIVKKIIEQLSASKSKIYRRRVFSWDKKAIQLLANYTFPGNIRELKNVLDELYVFNENLLVTESDVQNLIYPLDNVKNGTSANSELLEDLIRLHCLRSFKKYKSKTETSKRLGISVNTLNKYLK